MVIDFTLHSQLKIVCCYWYILKMQKLALMPLLIQQQKQQQTRLSDKNTKNRLRLRPLSFDIQIVSISTVMDSKRAQMLLFVHSNTRVRSMWIFHCCKCWSLFERNALRKKKSLLIYFPCLFFVYLFWERSSDIHVLWEVCVR